MTVGDLVIASATDKSTVSRSLVQLISEGLVEKMQCERDGRVFYVQLTAKGKKLGAELKKFAKSVGKSNFQRDQRKQSK